MKSRSLSSAISRNHPSALSECLAQRGIALDEAQILALRFLQGLLNQLQVEKPARKMISLGRRKPEPLKGVYMHGGVGRGKSMLMDIFFDQIPPEVSHQRLHFHEFMIRVHDYLHQERRAARAESGPDRALLRFADLLAREARVLCFDEFHVTDIADAMILGRLFTALFDKGMIVVATSNWPPERLYEGGLQRDRFLPFIDLVRHRMEIIEVEGGTDYRLRHLSEEGVYFWPLGEHTSARMDQVYSHLTGNVSSHAEEFRVKGRTIHVRAAAKGVARFSFAELCEQPRGAEDYLKMAEIYHTVFLENVPKLAYDRRNEAKRLMTLVDTLYDSGTKLVVSAEAPPDQIYRGHDHEFEFQRTVSRLLEMQSPDYLQK
ncbi:MAG: AFG1 family ATPase [Micavibrio aeruginosavorus]|uniref:AFG1 family ATPase n=1 Tax=Micavibrio aeruginosavorus TaxID=349221 RepID=A0A7T5UIT1_9BACT|nr:MAG: AFG1 family ATPase [Micavibrio aeruginosavorus]